MQAATVSKYAKVSTAKLKVRAQTVFNAWVRRRDEGECCISCGEFKTLEAGHYYSAGHHNNLRFTEDNVHGQCNRCNWRLHGNLTQYRFGLIKKIGIERVEQLDLLAKIRTPHKDDRFLFIDIIERYR